MADLLISLAVMLVMFLLASCHLSAQANRRKEEIDDTPPNKKP